MKTPNHNTKECKKTEIIQGAAIVQEYLEGFPIWKVYYQGQEQGWSTDYKVSLDLARQLVDPNHAVNTN